MVSYLFTSSILLFVFSLGYFVFLRQAPALALRRRVLLIGTLGSVLLPFFPSPNFPALFTGQQSAVQIVENWVYLESEFAAAGPVVSIDKGSFSNTTVEMVARRSLSPRSILILAYRLIALLFVGRIVYGLLRLRRITRRSRPTGERRIRILRDKGEAFTFGRTVYVSQSVYDAPDIEVILTHEAAHARQLHTIDALLAELLRAFFWFHPLVWWLREQVQLNLEYLADEAVLAAGYDKRDYQLSLVAHQQGVGFGTSLLPQFAAKGLKRRIKMMGFRAGSQVRSLVASGGLIFFAFLTFAVTNGKAQSANKQSDVSQTRMPLNSDFKSLYNGKAIEYNVYFKRLPTPSELEAIRQPLEDFFNQDFYVYQDCLDPAGTFTFALGTPTQTKHSVKLSPDDFSEQPYRFQINKDGKGNTGAASFRTMPLPAGAPDGDIIFNFNGSWISIATTDKTPFSEDNLTIAPINIQINCQLGTTPENKSGFNVSSNSIGSGFKGSTPREYVESMLQGYQDEAGKIIINKAFYAGQEELTADVFYERAKEEKQVLTIAKRVGDTEIFVVVRLDPAVPGVWGE